MATTMTPPTEQNPPWHTRSVDEALHALGVDEALGLNPEEVSKRFEQYGPNRFAATQREPGWHAFLRQYRDPMQIVLVVAGLISGVVLRQWGTTFVLCALTLFNALIGLLLVGKAEASVAALQKMMIVKVRVRRNGQVLDLPAEDLVPGDMVLLEAGDRVPADGRLIKAATMEVDESALTGESMPVPKQVEPAPDADKPLGDRADMAYMQTNVTHGAGELLVTATGMATEVEHIFGMLQTATVEQAPLSLSRLFLPAYQRW